MLRYMAESYRDYTTLTKDLAARFKAAANSSYALVVINLDDNKIVYINNNLLRSFNLQWSDMLLDMINSYLLTEDEERYQDILKIITSKHAILRRFIPNNEQQEYRIKLSHQDVSIDFNLKYFKLMCTSSDHSFNLVYGLSESPISNLCEVKPSETFLDPYINSLTKLMYVVTDNYTKFWMFISGVAVSITIMQLALYFTQPAVLCNPNNKGIIEHFPGLKVKPKVTSVK